MNSWGTGKDGQMRSSGVTADGLLKVQMGLLGVGTPDATYGVSCYPAAGAALNLNSDQPWTRNRRRPLKPLVGDRETCYSYTLRRGDTVASIVDHFGLDIRQVKCPLKRLQLFALMGCIC
jgi:hypothetical protein